MTSATASPHQPCPQCLPQPKPPSTLLHPRPIYLASLGLPRLREEVGLRVLQEMARSRGEEVPRTGGSCWGAVGKYLQREDTRRVL